MQTLAHHATELSDITSKHRANQPKQKHMILLGHHNARPGVESHTHWPAGFSPEHEARHTNKGHKRRLPRSGSLLLLEQCMRFWTSFFSKKPDTDPTPDGHSNSCTLFGSQHAPRFTSQPASSIEYLWQQTHSFTPPESHCPQALHPPVYVRVPVPPLTRAGQKQHLCKQCCPTAAMTVRLAHHACHAGTHPPTRRVVHTTQHTLPRQEGTKCQPVSIISRP
jgi:hypothetical protein